MGWKDQLLKKGADIVGRALPKTKWVKDKTGTITGVKAGSGKIPSHVGAGKDLKERAKIVQTHFSLKRSRKIDKLEAQIKEAEKGKEGLKTMVETGQAEKIGERHYKKGFKN